MIQCAPVASLETEGFGIEDLYDALVGEELRSPIPALLEFAHIQNVPLVHNDGYVAVEVRAAKALEPLDSEKLILHQAFLGTVADQEDAGDDDEGTKGIQAGHNVVEVDQRLDIVSPEASGVDEEVLLAADDAWTDVIILSPLTLLRTCSLEKCGNVTWKATHQTKYRARLVELVQ
jgi:hypothetical protein